MLKKRDDIKKVFSSKKYYFSSILVRYCPNDQNCSRFVIVPERKTHGAVGRNLIRRRISEILRTNQQRIREGFDIAFFVKRDILDFKYEDLSDLLVKALEKGGFLRS